jgi:thiamine pyrophosphate-dependent acetolactate synthase large subunit-like protein
VVKKKAVPGVGKARLADIARGAGIARAYELQTLADLERSLADILQEPGPTVVDLHVGPRLMLMSGS